MRLEVEFKSGIYQCQRILSLSPDSVKCLT